MTIRHRPSFLASFDLYDWVLTGAALACVVSGFFFAPFVDRENWSFVSGPLFTLTSGLLFVVAIRFQAREHWLALAEMKQANANHEQLLLVARHEKEFNTCLAACTEVRDHLNSMRFGAEQGATALRSITAQWVSFFAQGTFELPNGMRQFLGPSHDHESTLPQHRSIRALLTKLYWIHWSIRSRRVAKDLDPRDREFIEAIIVPLIFEVGSAIERNIALLSNRLDEIMDYPDATLDALQVSRTAIELCQVEIAAIRQLFKSPPGMPPSQP